MNINMHLNNIWLTCDDDIRVSLYDKNLVRNVKISYLFEGNIIEKFLNEIEGKSIRIKHSDDEKELLLFEDYCNLFGFDHRYKISIDNLSEILINKKLNKPNNIIIDSNKYYQVIDDNVPLFKSKLLKLVNSICNTEIKKYENLEFEYADLPF